MPSASQYNTTNYLVPAGGQTHAVTVSGNFAATPYLVDWRQFKIDAFPFQPQGLFADNSQGTTELVVTILPLGWKINIAPGTRWQGSFPAPNGQTATITGDPDNTASVTFVDFPVFENTSSNGASAVVISNTQPISVNSVALPAENKAGTISGGSTNLTLTPATAAKNLRRLQIALSGNASLAAAGTLTITATANGIAVYTATVWLPAAANANAAPSYEVADIDFSDIQFPMLAGDLEIDISSPLNTGALTANGWFSA